jgi:hypothetical protein
MGATREAISIFWHGAEDTEADAADEANVDYPAMAEAGRSEVYIDTGGQYKVKTGRLSRQECHH